MRVKICGITNFEDAKIASDLGAWALGFVFYAKSPRFISPSQAGEIISRLPTSVSTIGVFVNPTLKEVEQAVQESGIHTVQLHGDETSEFCQTVGVPVIKAFRLQNEEELIRVESYRQVEAVLMDAAVPGKWGGTGTFSNWRLAEMAKGYHKVILSGGLSDETVRLAISAVKPDAIDVSSGVEDFPGKKSRKKLEKFFKEISL